MQLPAISLFLTLFLILISSDKHVKRMMTDKAFFAKYAKDPIERK